MAKRKSDLQELVERYDVWKLAAHQRAASSLTKTFSTFNTNDEDLPWDFGTVRVPGLASAASTVRRAPVAQSTIRAPQSGGTVGSIVNLADLKIGGESLDLSGSSASGDPNKAGAGEVDVEDGFETIKAAPPAKKPATDTIFKGSPQAQAGRQLSDVALLPVIKNLKSGEHSPEDLEALSVLERGIADISDINPSLLLAFFTQALTQIKANNDLMKQMESQGGVAVTEAIGALGNGKLLDSEAEPASSPSSVGSNSTDTTLVEEDKPEPKAEEVRSSASPVAEALYARWIEHLRSKWPIVA